MRPQTVETVSDRVSLLTHFYPHQNVEKESGGVSSQTYLDVTAEADELSSLKQCHLCIERKLNWIESLTTKKKKEKRKKEKDEGKEDER